MTVAGGLVARLAEAGIDPQLLSDVAEALFVSETKAAILDERRRKDRERKPRKSEEVHGNPQRSEEIPETPSPLSPPKVSPEPPTNTPPLSPNPEASCEAMPVLKPEHVVEAWNDMAEPLGLPTVRKLTPERRKRLATRIRSNTIDEFTEAIAAVPRSPFLRGENNRGWKADFDWMLEPKNFTKLTEGTYDR